MNKPHAATNRKPVSAPTVRAAILRTTALVPIGWIAPYPTLSLSAGGSRRGDLIKIIWHDGIGMSLYAKRLDRGRFIWPQTVGGAVALTAAQLGYMLEGIDWRHPQQTWRPAAAG